MINSGDVREGERKYMYIVRERGKEKDTKEEGVAYGLTCSELPGKDHTLLSILAKAIDQSDIIGASS